MILQKAFRETVEMEAGIKKNLFFQKQFFSQMKQNLQQMKQKSGLEKRNV